MATTSPNARRLFFASLVTLVLLYAAYGFKRFALGVDFTDEGAYAAWPLRMAFGEKLFSSELGTLLRPLAAHLFVIFKVAPETTLFQFRLIGWAVHLASFVALSACVFRVAGGPLRSPLLASIPFFACHLFGLASPSYNNVSSDFFTIALSLRVLGALPDATRPRALQAVGGLALFLATLAHPVLGVVAALLVVDEILRGRLLQNLLRRRPSPSNLGVLVFVGAWAVFVGYLFASGAAMAWFERVRLFRSFTATSLESHPLSSWLLVMAYPFAFNRFALACSVAGLLVCGWLRFSAPGEKPARLVVASASLGLLLLFAVIYGFSYQPSYLPVYVALAALLATTAACLARNTETSPVGDSLRVPLLLSVVAAVLYATVTYYFSPLRSWTSGILGVPFGFALGLALLLRQKPAWHAGLFQILGGVMLGLAVACVARDHYRSIYRDGAIPELTATFRAPKLHPIRTTPAREQAVDALYDYLHPKINRGDPLLVFDDCPLLYFLFDAKPAYGLAWAARYTQSPAALAQLDREFRAAPLPRYAIRLLVDTSALDWEKAPRADYADYPLNATVMSHYELEKTIFPFEIWRLSRNP